MAGLGLQGGFGLAGAQDELKQLLARRFMEQITRQKLAQDQAEMEMRQAVAQQQLAQGDRRIGLDEREFGFRQDRAGVEDQRYATEAPVRLRYQTAQAENLEREPQEQEAARQHAEKLIGLREGSEGRLIGLRNEGDLNVARIRAANSAASRPRIQQVIGINAQGQPVTRIVNLDTQEVLAEFPRGLTPEEAAQQEGIKAEQRAGGAVRGKEAARPDSTPVKILKWLTGEGQQPSAEEESKRRADELLKKYGGL